MPLAEIAEPAEVDDWLTQIKQIDRIICAYLRNLREIISVTCCERPLAEIADAAEVDDWLTQINQIDRIICAYLRNLREDSPGSVGVIHVLYGRHCWGRSWSVGYASLTHG